MSYDDLLPPDEPLDRRVTIGLAKIGIALKQQAWAEAGGRGLTPTQGQVLALLRAAPEACDCASWRKVSSASPPHSTDSVAALQRKGLVAAKPSAGDGRGVVVVMTPAGSREAAAAAAWPDSYWRRSASSTAEQATFLRALVAMIRTLQAKGRIPVARMCVSCRFFQPFRHDNPARPHHCAFVDAAFGDGELRPDCPDHRTAPADQAAHNWEAFRASTATDPRRTP